MANDKQKKRAIEAGSAIGTVGGAVLGYKGVKAAGRVRRGASWGRSAYRMSRRQLGTGRVSSAAMATRVSGSGVRGPKKGASIPAIGAGYLGAVTGSYAGGEAGNRVSDHWKYKKKSSVSKARIMSDAEIKRRKKLQSHISQAGGAIGLAALGGTLAASRPGRQALRKIPKLEGKIRPPAPKDPNRDRIKGATTPLLATGAGLGGVGSFNFASYTNSESRKRNMAQPVKKSFDELAGDEGHALTHEQIEEAAITKAWEPTARKYDPEAKRHKRSKNYQTGLAATSAGTATGAALAGTTALVHESKNRKAGAKIAEGFKGGVKVIPEAGRLKAVKSGKVAAGLGAASLATGAGAGFVHRQRKGSWQSYQKRDATSAFGVDHSDNPNGQHRETEN